MICVIRITGDVHLSKDVRETLERLRLRRKYACVVLKGTPVEMGMVKKVRDFVAYGTISDDVYKKLVAARGKKDAQGKLKPFFRLHPPRKGIDAKKHVGVDKGVLGDHKDKLDKLLERML